MAVPTLSTSRYLFVGTYLGQYISPKAVSLSTDRRLPTAYGRGNRLASVYNIEIRRSFIYGEQLTFPPVAPFISVLSHASDGTQDSPVKVYKSSGEIVRPDQYHFLQSVPGGAYDQLLIRTENFDQTATYYVDYQSTDRAVLDPLPVNDLREIRALGEQVNQEKFKEYEDFYIPMIFPSEITRDPTNTHYASSVEVPVPGVGNTGTGTLTQNTASQFVHNYTRFYSVTCVASGGAPGARSASFTWAATPMSGGNFAYPPSPLNPAAPANSLTINEAVVSSMTQDIELGIKVNFNFGATNYVLGDTFVFNGLGPAMFEIDVRHTNTNETIQYGPVVPASTNTGAGIIEHAPNTAYNGDADIGVNLICITSGGTAPNRTAQFAWATYRELGSNGTFIVNEALPASLNQLLAQGLRFVFNFGISNFAPGDQFATLINVPFKHVYFKDDRTYKLTITAATNPTVTTGHVEGTYSVNTLEGGFGIFSATSDTVGTQTGRFDLPDNLRLIARNMVRGGLPQTNQHVVTDKHAFTATLSDVVDFSLTKPAVDERDPSAGDQVLLDVTGAVTGISGTYYSILSYVPLTAPVAVLAIGGAPVVIAQIPNSSYVKYTSGIPSGKVIISYRHRGLEPDPGQIYYFTANYLRPDEFYNKLYVVSSLEEGRRLLGPASKDNHLYLANELAWSQPGNLQAAGFVQVKDTDSDGVYTVTDYRTAIQSVQASSLITDKTVLSRYDAWSDALADNIKQSDPFEAKEHLWWFGAPINTPVGDIDTVDSLVYLARKTLQVYGDSPAHGTRILCSPTWGDILFKLQDGTETTVRVDGSFFAFAQACKVGGQTSTSDSILLTNTNGFSLLHIHSEAERLMLGASNIVFPVDLGGGIYQNYEDITVDTYAPDFENIAAMVQKQDVTRAVRTAMNSALIKLKITSGEQAIGITTGVLVRILQGLQIEGRIASYQDESGNIRPLDASTDIRVYRDQDTPTQLAFFFNYFLTYTLKRLLGLYTVDTAKLELPPSGNATNV